MSLLHLLHSLSGGMIPDDEERRRRLAAEQGPGGELPPSSAPYDPNATIEVTGAKRTHEAPRPQSDIVDVPPPSVVQPSYKQEAPAEDPAMVDPNNKAILDRRAMLWNAEEAQKEASAKAAGGEYKPRYQNGEDFKSHPGMQFGTHGLARDVIGNATDFLGSLVGRKPTYREEKFQDKIYGWDQPGQYEGAMHRGMSYDRGLTQEFMAQQDKIHGTDATIAANAEYKTQQSNALKRDALGSAAFGIYGAADPEQAYTQGGRERMQASLDDMYPEGKAPQLPEQYNENVVKSFYTAGYKGKDVASTINTGMRAKVALTVADRNNATRQLIAEGHDRKDITVAMITSRARENAARISASSKPEPTPSKVGVRTDILGTSTDSFYVPRGQEGQGRPFTTKNGVKGTRYPNGTFVPN